MWLGFFKECMVSLILLGINLLSPSITFFFWSQLKLRSAFQQCLTTTFRWWEKYLPKRSLINHICSWRDKLIVLWRLSRQAKIFLRIGTLAEQLSNCCHYFFRLSGFPDLSGKVLLITFKSSWLGYSTMFGNSNVNKTDHFFFSFAKV